MSAKKSLPLFLAFLLCFSPAFAQNEGKKPKTPREGRNFYIDFQIGGLYNLRFGPDAELALISLHWLATDDLSFGYELSWVGLPVPSLISYGETRHYFMARYFPFESLPGLYFEGGAGILTNKLTSIDGGGTTFDDIDVPYAFFFRTAAGYCFALGSRVYFGVGIKYHVPFYHPVPTHEILVVLDFMIFLF